MEYADFCRLLQKGADLNLALSWVTGPILTKLAHNVSYNIAIEYF